MLWEIVTQEMPIRGALRDVRVPQECPGPIKSLISKCMAREPDMRPTADEVAYPDLTCLEAHFAAAVASRVSSS